MLDIGTLINHAVTGTTLAGLVGVLWRVSAWKERIEARLEAGRSALQRHQDTDCELKRGLQDVNTNLGRIQVTLARMDEREMLRSGLAAKQAEAD